MYIGPFAMSEGFFDCIPAEHNFQSGEFTSSETTYNYYSTIESLSVSYAVILKKITDDFSSSPK